MHAVDLDVLARLVGGGYDDWEVALPHQSPENSFVVLVDALFFDNSLQHESRRRCCSRCARTLW